MTDLRLAVEMLHVSASDFFDNVEAMHMQKLNKEWLDEVRESLDVLIGEHMIRNLDRPSEVAYSAAVIDSMIGMFGGVDDLTTALFSRIETVKGEASRAHAQEDVRGMGLR